MSAPRLTLAQQIALLDADSADPEERKGDIDANADLDGLAIPKRRDEGREHYLEVGPSRLRAQAGGVGLGERYGGEVRRRRKIFEDDTDEDEDEGEEQGMGDAAFGAVEDEEDDEEENEDEGDGSEEDAEEDEDDEEGDEEEGDGEEDERDEENDQGGAGRAPLEPSKQIPGPLKAGRTLDPLAALKDSRLKDIEKGRGIKRQKDLFDALLTLRITFQKALTTAAKLPTPLPLDAEGEVEAKRAEALASLAGLSDKLFELREALPLSGAETSSLKRKREREDGDELEEGFWVERSRESLEMVDVSRPHMLPILQKWSSKIQAASLSVGGKEAGSSKFLQSTKGSTGIIEAIEAGMAAKRESDKSVQEMEDDGYRALLREVIESRAGGAGLDLSHLRKEKKKKREAERGGSKGRKLRYTVHEKAQNFVVPMALSSGWHEEQVDELFSSLFGGVGMSGAAAETGPGSGLAGEGLAGLDGLRVF